MDGAVGAPPDRVPGFPGNRAGRIRHVVSRLTDRGCRIARVAPVRMDVRYDFLGSAHYPLPPLVDVLEELEVLGRVHSGHRCQPVVTGRLRLVPGLAGRLEEPVDPLRYLGVGLRSTIHQKMPRIMAALEFVEDDL